MVHSSAACTYLQACSSSVTIRLVKACGWLHMQVESEKVCQTGLEEEAELHWKADQAAALMPCQGIKHTFARIARECPDVRFLSLNVSHREPAVHNQA